MNPGPHHPDVERFLVLYNRLRDWTDDDPSVVRATANDDDKFKRLCCELWSIEHRLRRAEEEARTRFARTVGPDFIEAWRDCENRYSAALNEVEFFDLFPELANGSFQLPKQERSAFEIEIATEQAQEEADAIERAIEYSEYHVDLGRMGVPDALRSHIQAGLEEWKRLTRTIGFSLEGILRRRKLIPFILVPRHVADRHGNKELGLLSHLQQAHEAFVYGVPFAALALMRSVLETVLKTHYAATGVDLATCINNAKRLPALANKEKLHQLRKLANDILHPDAKQLKTQDFEIQIIEHLHALRALIENAPRYPSLTVRSRS